MSYHIKILISTSNFQIILTTPTCWRFFSSRAAFLSECCWRSFSNSSCSFCSASLSSASFSLTYTSGNGYIVSRSSWKKCDCQSHTFGPKPSVTMVTVTDLLDKHLPHVLLLCLHLLEVLLPLLFIGLGETAGKEGKREREREWYNKQEEWRRCKHS